MTTRIIIGYFGKYNYEIDTWLDQEMPKGNTNRWTILTETNLPTFEQVITVNFINEDDALWFSLRWL
jgi:hypothetical protein